MWLRQILQESDLCWFKHRTKTSECYNSLLAERLQALVKEFIRFGAKECEKFLYGATGNVNKRTFMNH